MLITGKKLMAFPLYLAVCFGLVAFSFSCSKGGNPRPAGDRLLARVYDRTLYLSDMEGMIPEGMSAEDSVLIINAFVGNWVREAAMQYEAERNIPKDLNLDKLVRDYRASLIKHNYENLLVSNLLDSTVTAQQLEEFYQKNKEQYQLETPIIRCRFIKVERTAPQLDRVQDWWNSKKGSDYVLLKNWCRQNAIVHHLQDSIWYKVEDIAAYMPQGTLTVDNVNSRRDFIQRNDNFQYFFKVMEVVSRKEIAPLAYIEDQARKVILHQRKNQLLEEMKEKFYSEALRKNNIQILK
jgi:hypothetical protein